MRNPLPQLFLALLLLPAAAKADPAAVERSFEAYRQAVLSGDGAAAAEVVTSRSHAFYKSLADYALTLDREGLARLHVTERLTVMQLRHSVDPQVIARMSGKDLVASAVNSGWIGKGRMADLRLGAYDVRGELASVPVLDQNGEAGPITLHFLKEEGKWRLDLVSVLAISRGTMDYVILQSGMTEDEFVLFALEYNSGRKPGPEIWDPPQ